MIDPHLAQLLATIKDMGFPRIGSVSAQILRSASRPMPVQTELASVRDLEIPSGAGPIPARLYRNTDTPEGLIVYYHGGGWVIGNLDSVDATLRLLTLESGYAVLSIDYRLAPEHRFPAAVEDAWESYLWAADHRADLAGDTDALLVVMGDSAGGNLAAVVAQLAAKAGDRRISQQVLVYPATAGDPSAQPAPAFEPPFLALDEMIWFYNQYVPESAGPEVHEDPRLAPAKATDLSGLAPALVLTAGLDILAAEGQSYAARLADAGIEMAELRYPTAIHGFFTMASMLPIGRKAIVEVSQGLKRRDAVS